MAPLMEVTFLGTGSANPTPTKAASCTVLRLVHHSVLIDYTYCKNYQNAGCGETAHVLVLYYLGII